MVKKEISPAQSFEGFKLSENLKSSLKKAAIILIPAILAELATQNGTIGIIAGVAASIVNEALKFYAKDIEL